MNVTFVDQNYQFNPDTEIQLLSGTDLSEGMEVLVADPLARVDVAQLTQADIWLPKLTYWHTPPFKKPQSVDVNRRLTREEMLEENPQRDLVREALRMNRWCVVFNVDITRWHYLPDCVDFAGAYSDGTVMAHYQKVDTPWLVRKPAGPYK